MHKDFKFQMENLQCDQVFQRKNHQLLVKNRQICRRNNKLIFQTPKYLHQS